MEEASLIQEIVEHPELDEPKLVYADWLEERSDSRAEFLRLQCEFDGFDFDHSAVKDLKQDLLEYWETIDPEWLAQVGTKYNVWLLGATLGKMTVVKLLKRFGSLGIQDAIGRVSDKGPSRILWGLDLPKAESSLQLVSSVQKLFPLSKLVVIIPHWRDPPEENVQEV